MSYNCLWKKVWNRNAPAMLPFCKVDDTLNFPLCAVFEKLVIVERATVLYEL